MDLKKCLEELKILDIEIKAKEGHIKELRLILDALYTTVKNERMSDLKERHLTELREIIWDFEFQLIACFRKKVEAKRIILGVIQNVKNHDYRVILELKYVSLKTWEEIAEMTNYSVRNMHNIHKRALRMFGESLSEIESKSKIDIAEYID